MRNSRHRSKGFVVPFSIALALIVTLPVSVTYAQVPQKAVITGDGGYWGPVTLAIAERGKGKAVQNDITFFRTVFSSDMVAAGYGGMRNIGTGSIVLAGITGSITKAYLYWMGPTNSPDTLVNATVTFNGASVTGKNIGLSNDNCWGYLNSQAYRADVTSRVTGNGTYTLADFIKGTGGSIANVNGVSLIVFFNDGNPANNRDFVVFEGNDSNIPNSYDADGWNVTLPGIQYVSGNAGIQMHVADGQSFPDAALILNGSVLVPAGEIFDGNTVPNGASAGSTNGGLWDIKSFDITSFMTPGLDTLILTSGVNSDCLGLVVAIIDLPAGAAPGQPTSISGMKFDDLNANGVKDPGEPGIAGWIINLTGPVNETTTTDSSGDYLFAPLAPGTYSVSEQSVAGWSQTAPPFGTYTITLALNQTSSGNDFGNRRFSGGRGTIKGMIFEDQNGNGLKDALEPGLSNWTIQLTGRDVRKATQRDPQGNYSFTGVPQGNYTVTQMVPDGWLQTMPANGQPYTFTLANNADRAGVDFGDQDLATAVNERVGNPNEYALYQNYPNPFNPTTRLSFYLPKDGYVALRVYNVLGIEVASIFEGRMSGGMHSLVWDAQDIPSGVYVYRLTAGTFSAVKKMILMK
jgi:hypothetical protein